jgi:hypothetical protein
VQSGPAVGRVVYIPRIDHITTYGSIMRWVRVQFPVRLAWATTINKAQGETRARVYPRERDLTRFVISVAGQTLDKVGIFLPRNISQHGLTYVAFSRVRKSADIKVTLHGDAHQGQIPGTKDRYYMRNFVDSQIWNYRRTAAMPPGDPLPMALPFMEHDNDVRPAGLVSTEDDTFLDEELFAPEEDDLEVSGHTNFI